MTMITFRGLAVLSLCAFTLAACEATEELIPFSGKKTVVPACPAVKFLQDADKITVFRQGPGRDITDIVYEADLTGFAGECEYVKDDDIFTEGVVTLRVGFDIARGPADRNHKADLAYFVAVPEFYPAPEGKTLFKRRIAFPLGRNNVSFVDDEVEIRIPLTNDRKGPNFKVFIGFELTQDQLKLNRRRGNSTGLGG